MRTVPLILVGYVVLSCSGTSTVSYFTESDKNHAKKILSDAIALKEVQTIHFGSLGLKLLGETISNPGNLCKILLNAANAEKASAEMLYFVSTSYKAVGNCPNALPVINIVKNLNSVCGNDTTNMQDLYYAVNALASIGQKPKDVAKLIKTIQAILKKNDSLANLGYLFHIASNLGADGAFAFERIEDAVVQADEVDSKFLQYEGGLSITALIINGIYKLSTALNKQPPISHEQAVKFANYFLTRKSVQMPKGVWSLLEALYTLTTNKFHLPLAVTLASNPSINNENPKISIKICNLFGQSVGSLTVLADSATRVLDDVVVLSKKKFEATPDSTIYTFNLMEAKPEKGMYKITISAKLDKPDPRVVSNIGSTINIKVMCEAGIEYIDIGTADADQTTQPKLERVQFPNKLSKPMEADTQQKIVLRFSIKDKLANKLISVHQAFVRFYNSQEDHSVVFVAEYDSSLQYKFDLDIGAKAVDFNHISGFYDLELIIGDSVLSNSFSWKVSSVKLTFTSYPKIDNMMDLYKPKSEIKHLFREPEKRPPRLLSNLFCVFVCLPLLLLLVLWIKLRINVSNFKFTLTGLGFHLGLGAIFGLFGLFWLKLNMFQTMKFLSGLGCFTFLCGNKLLRNIAHNKK